MARGEAPEHFRVIGRILSRLRREHGVLTPWLLDAGCGSAYYSEVVEHFVPRWTKYVGVDFNAGMLELARRCYPSLSLARMDLCGLALRDRMFDVVMSGAVIVHIKPWRQAVQELARTTRRWLILHRTLVYTHRPTTVDIERHYDTDVYRVRINQGELIALLSDNGLKLIGYWDCPEGRFPKGQENHTYLFERVIGSTPIGWETRK